MKVLVISGFLGAGKTTFIRELMKQSGKPMAILENDYGAVGVDAYRLQKGPRSYSEIWEMTEGCICCSKRGDSPSYLFGKLFENREARRDSRNYR